MSRNFMIIGAVAGAFTVALGAFGAHALKDVLNPERLQVYETAIRYLGRTLSVSRR